MHGPGGEGHACADTQGSNRIHKARRWIRAAPLKASAVAYAELEQQRDNLRPPALARNEQRRQPAALRAAPQIGAAFGQRGHRRRVAVRRGEPEGGATARQAPLDVRAPVRQRLNCRPLRLLRLGPLLLP